MISVCMPYWNERELLKFNLQRMTRHYDDLEFELSICDDGSLGADRLRSIAKWIPPKARVVVTELPYHLGRRSPITALTRAIEASHEDHIFVSLAQAYHLDPILREVERFYEHRNKAFYALAIRTARLSQEMSAALMQNITHPMGVRRNLPDADRGSRKEIYWLQEEASARQVSAASFVFHRKLWDTRYKGDVDLTGGVGREAEYLATSILDGADVCAWSRGTVCFLDRQLLPATPIQTAKNEEQMAAYLSERDYHVKHQL